MLPDVEVAEERIEFIAGLYVVVVLQDVQRQAFAETARTDEKDTNKSKTKANLFVFVKRERRRFYFQHKLLRLSRIIQFDF